MTGRGLSEFEEMQQVYLAIRDLDKVIASDSKAKLEDAWNVIAEVSKDKFDPKYVESILDATRSALIQIFKEKEAAIDNSIGLTRS